MFLAAYIIDGTIYLVYDTSIGHVPDYIVTENQKTATIKELEELK